MTYSGLRATKASPNSFYKREKIQGESKKMNKKPANNSRQTESFRLTISKDELALLPPEKVSGEIVVVDTDSAVKDMLPELAAAELIGFDTETKPAFKKGQLNRVALLQLSTASKSFLVRLSKIGFPEAIKDFLEDSTKTKIGLSVKDDFHSLAKLGPFNPDGFIDLQDYVKEFNIADCSLTKIHAIVFGTRISKGQQLTNWEATQLTKKQQEYAALDALACINIYKKLQSGEFDPSTSQYRKEICQEKE